MNKKALIVIDMLNDFVDHDGALYIGKSVTNIIPEIQKKLSAYRSDGSPIFYICDCHDPKDTEFEMFPPHCVECTKGAEIYKDLRPREGEHIIRKKKFSGFHDTHLDELLKENHVDTVELVGVCTQICVLYTCFEARNLGYKVVVDRRCVDSFERSAHEFALKEMERTLGAKIV